MKVFFAVIFVSLLAVSGTPYEVTSKQNLVEDDSKYQQFVQTLRLINAIGHLDDTSDRLFFKNSHVQRIYSDSQSLKKVHQRIWGDAKIDTETKRFSARICQCLPKAERLQLIQEAFVDLKAAKISSKTFATLISPGSEWSSWVDVHYGDADLVRVLHRIRNDPSTGKDLAGTIDLILDGTGNEFLLEYGADVAQKLKCEFD